MPRTNNQPKHVLGGTLLEIQREITMASSALDTLHVSVQKGNRLQRMLGRGRASLGDDTSIKQYVQNNAAELKNFFRDLTPDEFKRRLRDHINRHEAGLSDTEVAEISDRVHRVMTEEMDRVMPTDMAGIIVQDLQNIGNGNGSTPGQICNKKRFVRLTKALPARELENLTRALGQARGISDWNDPHGEAGKMLLLALTSSSLSIEDNVQVLDNMGALNTLGGDLRMGSEAFIVLVLNSYSTPEDGYGKSITYLDSLTDTGNMTMAAVADFSQIPQAQRIGSDVETLATDPLEHSVHALCVAHNIKKQDLDSGGVLNSDPFIRKLLMKRLPHMNALIGDDGRSITEMLQPDIATILQDKSDPRVQRFLTNQTEFRGLSDKEIERRLILKLKDKLDSVMIGLGVLRAAKQSRHPEVEGLLTFHAVMSMYSSGANQDELPSVEALIGDIDDLNQSLGALPSSVGQDLDTYLSGVRATLKAHKAKKPKNKPSFKDRKATKDWKIRFNDWEARGIAIQKELALSEYKWIQENV